MAMPKLYVGARPTRALSILRAAASQHGYAHPYHPLKYRSWKVYGEQQLLHRLCQSGLIVRAPIGPRRGLAWAITPTGEAVLGIAEAYGKDYKTPLAVYLGGND